MKITGIRESLFGTLKGIETDEWIGGYYSFDEIESIDAITPSTGHSVGGAATGAIIGAFLLGPIGTIAGGVIGAGKNIIGVQVTLKDGRVFVAEMKTKLMIKCATGLSESKKKSS